MMDRSCLRKEELRVREKIFRASSQSDVGYRCHDMAMGRSLLKQKYEAEKFHRTAKNRKFTRARTAWPVGLKFPAG